MRAWGCAVTYEDPGPRPTLWCEDPLAAHLAARLSGPAAATAFEAVAALPEVRDASDFYDRTRRRAAAPWDPDRQAAEWWALRQAATRCGRWYARPFRPGGALAALKLRCVARYLSTLAPVVKCAPAP